MVVPCRRCLGSRCSIVFVTLSSVRVAGASGGFDIYAGLPLAFALSAEGKNAHLANLSFSSLVDPDFWIAPGLFSSPCYGG